jgi:hypothetical protein
VRDLEVIAIPSALSSVLGVKTPMDVKGISLRPPSRPFPVNLPEGLCPGTFGVRRHSYKTRDFPAEWNANPKTQARSPLLIPFRALSSGSLRVARDPGGISKR